MGVDCTLFTRLVDLSTRFQVRGGRSLMLGRQTFRLEPQFRAHYRRALKAAGRDEGRFDFLQEDEYSETLFRELGLGEIETMDLSDFEGATILHDLNKSVGKDLHGEFDFIFDGGTIEHVFHAPMALENVFHMLRPGGIFVSANGMNGWVGHGMYQFNPEMVWTFWKRTAHCTVHRCFGLTKKPGKGPPLVFPDPAETGKRLRLKGKIPPERMYLYYEIEKTPQSALGDTPLQSDYVTKWNEHETLREGWA